MPSLINFSFLPQFWIFILGLFIGSFLGVLIDRIPRKENVIKGRSYCEYCRKELLWYDLLPVLSFIFLKGKCRYCKTQLPIFYPIIEISTGILFSLTYVFLISNSQFLISNQILNFIYYLFIVSCFIVIFFTDLKYGIIPNRVIYPATIVSFVFLLLSQRNLFLNHLVSGLLSFAFFVVVSYLFFMVTKKESMGGGDIKLAFFLGLFLGFPNIIVSLYIAFLTGAFVSIILILWKKKSFQKGTLPFGPFLVSGALVSIFWGGLIFSKVLMFLGY